VDTPPSRIILDRPDVPSMVRDHLARHPECLEWDAHDLAQALRLSEVEVQYALEALTVEGVILP
jgi:hypothetical protein